jgi:hypothetical protein
VALDEVRLQEQRLGLGVGDGHLDVVGRPDHLPDPLAPGVRVRADALAEVDGLAHVEHPPGVVRAELVDAGLCGQVGRRVPDTARVHVSRYAARGFESHDCRPVEPTPRKIL